VRAPTRGSEHTAAAQGRSGRVPRSSGNRNCTLTQGYWKNHHSQARNASQQLPWPLPEDSELCGRSWLDILGSPTRGDAWMILAHQWIAARLNVAMGADTTPAVDQALAQGSALLPLCAVPLAQRPVAIGASEVLDDFNNGRIGPGHCDDGGGAGEGGNDGGGADDGGADDGGGDGGGPSGLQRPRRPGRDRDEGGDEGAGRPTVPDVDTPGRRPGGRAEDDDERNPPGLRRPNRPGRGKPPGQADTDGPARPSHPGGPRTRPPRGAEDPPSDGGDGGCDHPEHDHGEGEEDHDGYSDGYDDGYNDGYSDGHNDGYDDGYGDGYERGGHGDDDHDGSYGDGYSDGYGDGYDDGHDDGHRHRCDDSCDHPDWDYDSDCGGCEHPRPRHRQPHNGHGHQHPYDPRSCPPPPGYSDGWAPAGHGPRYAPMPVGQTTTTVTTARDESTPAPVRTTSRAHGAFLMGLGLYAGYDRLPEGLDSWIEGGAAMAWRSAGKGWLHGEVGIGFYGMGEASDPDPSRAGIDIPFHGSLVLTTDRWHVAPLVEAGVFGDVRVRLPKESGDDSTSAFLAGPMVGAGVVFGAKSRIGFELRARAQWTLLGVGSETPFVTPAIPDIEFGGNLVVRF
jgi:hypothetical protein